MHVEFDVQALDRVAATTAAKDVKEVTDCESACVLASDVEVWNPLPDVGPHVELLCDLERPPIFIDTAKSVNECLLELSVDF